MDCFVASLLAMTEDGFTAYPGTQPMSTEPAKPPRPASTILLLRDSAATKGEIEVFMMVRHYEIDFNSGALVFPGGSVDKGDQEIIARPELYCGGEGLDAAAFSFR